MDEPPADDQLPARVRISACIVCRNEADRLADCLTSVSWVDEILIMDLQSQDSSVDIARAHGARVIQREPFPIVEPLRNELAARARAEWILALDPDERISPALATELLTLAQRDDIDAVVVPRMNWDFGYPPTSPIQRHEPQLRMYRRSQVTWPLIPNTLPVVPADRTYHLPRRDEVAILHDRNRNIPESLERAIRYAPAQAQSYIDQGRTFSAAAMLRAIFRQVDKEFFNAQSWRDGVPGLLRVWTLVAFKVYVWACFWQLSGAKRDPADDTLILRFGQLLNVARRGAQVCTTLWKVVARVLPTR
jgi:glycosyltransferase involved in cell wall biosynthesis